MNRKEKKEMAPEAARLFEQEVLALKPDTPREELRDMANEYIYYQTDDVSKEEAHAITDITCRLAAKGLSGVSLKTVFNMMVPTCNISKVSTGRSSQALYRALPYSYT